MASNFASVAFTEGIKAEQERQGSRRQYERMAESGPDTNRFSAYEREFIEARDSFYIATVTETGWPYVQHRGGPKGFVKVLDDKTLGFADFRGNRQYVSVGNLKHDDRVAIIWVDYPHQTRLKVLGRAEIVERTAGAEWFDQLKLPGYPAKVERAILIHLEAFDWNCQQHITPRWTAQELGPLRARVAELEAENQALREEISNGAAEAEKP
ncbi:MAG TPA: pyridoxamine 5'-phosphate oxidase family protein [Bryobacteraceae bacterium]|nr:pyridoxamine 5'-phosphate oxidase family protein [Bryobacteraceae bacterium]